MTPKGTLGGRGGGKLLGTALGHLAEAHGVSTATNSQYDPLMRMPLLLTRAARLLRRPVTAAAEGTHGDLAAWLAVLTVAAASAEPNRRHALRRPK